MQLFPRSLHPQRQILAVSFGFSDSMAFQLHRLCPTPPSPCEVFLIPFKVCLLPPPCCRLSASLPQLQIPSFPAETPSFATSWLLPTRAGSTALLWEVQSPVSSKWFCLTWSRYLEECNLNLGINWIRHTSCWNGTKEMKRENIRDEWYDCDNNIPENNSLWSLTVEFIKVHRVLSNPKHQFLPFEETIWLYDNYSNLQSILHLTQ